MSTMTRNEIKDIVKLAVTELDLRTTKGIGDLTAEFIRFQGIIPQLIADAIKDCRIYAEHPAMATAANAMIVEMFHRRRLP